MKPYLLIGFMLAALSFTSQIYANFILRSASPTVCEDIPGRWHGHGKATNWLIGECKYHGRGSLSSLDSSGYFRIEVTADKDSGSVLCPKHAHEELKGSCIDGVVTIMTNYGNLAGHFSPTQGKAQGTLSVGAGMSAEVLVVFERGE
ncbi:hypothetical protein [Legionella jamestowniensis]|uniref:Uncharacterized protein n=1 Tax=Legionella jamestowniensis TaxID=455 RepID=A0A0W0UG81_9GAMM|nr:hypothetical protein [Legionella jamestowniensis]KTD06926.1 hypothetical protein Ljam_1121 [Legionella jamestowniensis]OCH97448.1 hypothetical protein A8135_02950 [Legionella jamestowniensis]SFL85012.1 hypothetical protein SAMN02746073_2247 [Legionella jamestowniensis DSM 19215]